MGYLWVKLAVVDVGCRYSGNQRRSLGLDPFWPKNVDSPPKLHHEIINNLVKSPPQHQTFSLEFSETIERNCHITTASMLQQSR